MTVTPQEADAAFRAEIEWYRAHQLEGRDAEGLERLRAGCAEALNDALPEPLDPAAAREVMHASLRFEAYGDAAAALRALRARGLKVIVVSNWDVSLREVLADVGLLDLVDGVVTSAEVGAAKPERPVFEAALELADTRAADAVHVGDSPALDVAGAEAAGIRPILLRREGPAGGTQVITSLGELARSIDRPPWPAWYGPVGLLAALFIALLGAVFLGVFAESAGGDAEGPATLRLATLVQDVAFVAVALWLAARVARPRPEHFGLRQAPLWRSVGWTVVGAVAFITFAALYAAVIGTPEEQTTLEDLGAEDSTDTIVFVGVMVIVIAPFVEEFFFRGFVYGALRTRFAVLPAALLGGAIFGALHLPTGAEAVPPLIALGVMLSLVYERTGSLWPVIVLHALNNWATYGSQTGEAGIASAIGGATVLASLLLARASRRVA